MKIPANNIYSFILSILLFLPSPFIAAAQINNPSLLEFTLSAQHLAADLKFSTNSSYRTITNQLGINWYEPFTHYFHGGLEVGYLEMTQADNPLASAQYTSGEYAGLLLRFIPLVTDKLSLSLNLNYRYSQTSGSSTEQETQFAWNSAMFNTELEYQLTNQVGVLVAAEFQSLNGEQRDSGIVSKITEFTESWQQSTRFGVNFFSSRNGVIRIEKITGFRNGTRLYFVRKF
jgi:hypothetical protein